MNANELREKGSDELKTLESGLQKELFQLRMQLYTGQLDKPSRIRETRRAIARVKTILSARG